MIMLYNNIKVKVHSVDDDTDFFNMIARVLQADSFAQTVYNFPRLHTSNANRYH